MDHASIEAAADRLRAGGVVAFPTETVYGLGADALREDAVRRVFALKGRPANNPLIVHVADEAMARTVVRDWPDAASRLAARFWPGPLTLVLPRADRVPPIVAAGGPTLAIRSPDHPLAQALIRAFGGPIVGPSANPSGGVSPTRASHVRDAFDPRDVLVLDGGPCSIGLESTVLSLAHAPPRVLRPGAVSADQIAAVLGEEVLTASSSVPASAPLPSPGMLERHYAPQTPTQIAADLPAALRAGPPAIVMLVGPAAGRVPPPHIALELPPDAAGYAAAMYDALRRADAAGLARIVIERPSSPGPLWDAIRDRLSRAGLSA